MKNSRSAAKLPKGLSTLGAVAAALLLQSQVASAGPEIGFDPTGSGTYTTYADLWTNNTDSALSIGFNPATPAPYDIRLLAQARVGIMNQGADVVTPSGMNPSTTTNAATCAFFGGCFELTKVVDVNERVLSNNGTNANFGMTTQTADVDPTTAGLQQIAIYFDSLTDGLDAGRARPGNGAGTVSGYTNPGSILILSGRLVSNVSSFAASGAIGTGSFDLRYIIDYVNSSYLDVVTNSIIGDKITGTTNIPSQFTPLTMWNGTPTSAGLLLKMDSSESFIAASVPEPTPLALMGLGLVSLGASLARRRRKNQA